MQRKWKRIFAVLLVTSAAISGQVRTVVRAHGSSFSVVEQPVIEQTISAKKAPLSVSIARYIRDAWPRLTRSMTDCKSLADAKLKSRPVLYLPREYEMPSRERVAISECGVRVQKLPKTIVHLGDLKPADIQFHGLLYLPHPYVVPGGRFNEMYGWDSYFIIRGLLRDGQTELARDMIENFFFEIDHYGAILNANRTYYFTRSQPPFLTSMIQAFYESERSHGHEDKQWLSRAYEYAARDYDLWSHGVHLAGDTGLARYYDVGQGPVPEMGDDPHYYLEVANYLLVHPEDGRYGYIAQPVSNTAQPESQPQGRVFTAEVCDPGRPRSSNAAQCSSPQKLSLSEDYYKGDRSMRESGFDISFRFGPFGGSTHHFAPVCLNSLLYKAEADMEQFAALLGKVEEAREWHMRAEKRKNAINTYLWNSQRGMFFDYDFVERKQSSYDFIATFYPLWAGLATPEQATAVAANLGIFEKAGGVAMSDRETGVQWDLPYGWAPAQLITVEGLRRYGMDGAADRISGKFISMVTKNFQRDGTIREKYNVVTQSSETRIKTGYKSNVIGFGWTNGVVLELLQGLKHSTQAAD
jgi:alpha,alpha-trehalase